MKMFPEPKLPLSPRGAWEKYVLYSFEGRARGLWLNVVLFALMLVMWAATQVWVFGAFAGLLLIHLYSCIEARGLSRMIERVSWDKEVSSAPAQLPNER
jgi:hypothetical protein